MFFTRHNFSCLCSDVSADVKWWLFVSQDHQMGCIASQAVFLLLGGTLLEIATSCFMIRLIDATIFNTNIHIPELFTWDHDRHVLVHIGDRFQEQTCTFV